MRTTTLALVMMLLAFAASPLTAGPETDGSAASNTGHVSVGTFDTRGIALCYGRSSEFMDIVAGMKRERDEALEEGDDERVAELERLGPELQEKLHEQVFYGGPIPELLADLKDYLPDIAEAAGVDVIAGDLLYTAPGVEPIDITRFMVEPFEPDAKTLEILEELLSKPAAQHE